MPLDVHLIATAATVRPKDVVTYARAHRWESTDVGNTEFLVLAHPDHDLSQLLVPRARDRVDFGRRILDVAERLAEVEGRPVRTLLNDLQAPLADTLRVRVEAVTTAGGSIPLEHGIDVLRGTRDALLSTASSILRPARHHRRMSFVEAEALAARACLGQTEMGSFTVRVLCPIDQQDGDPAALLLPEVEVPFVRKVTRELMRSTEFLRGVITNGEVERLFVTEIPADQPVISANLCEALARFRREGEEVRVQLAVVWAPAFPQGGDPGPAVVTFESDVLEPLSAIAQRLRGENQDVRRLFVGSVETLNGDLDAEGRRFGQVEVHVLVDGELLRAKIDLSAIDYDVADKAHMQGALVAFTGLLRRGARKGSILEVADFRREDD